MTKKYAWPFATVLKRCDLLPPIYQISEDVWKTFVDTRLSATWKREKKVIVEDDKVDRSMLWIKGHEDKLGNITDPEVAAMKVAIVRTYNLLHSCLSTRMT